MWCNQYASNSIVSNFQLHRDSHSQIPTIAKTSYAPTLARSTVIRLPCLDSLSCVTGDVERSECVCCFVLLTRYWGI